jgi:hypothetical protein
MSGRDWRSIRIPEDVASAAAVPEDLDSGVVEPYAIPDTARRRRAGAVYFVAAALTALLIPLTGLPELMWATVVGALVAIGLYHLIAGWKLRVREGAALEIANRATTFPVGHASAALGFVGWRARPVWNVLMFSSDDPPSERGLVEVDAINGAVRGTYVEAVAAPQR